MAGRQGPGREHAAGGCRQERRRARRSAEVGRSGQRGRLPRRVRAQVHHPARGVHSGKRPDDRFHEGDSPQGHQALLHPPQHPDVHQAEVNRIVEDIAAKNGLTYGQFLDALDYQGISLNAFKQQISRQMLMAGVRNHAIQNSVDVTREQVDALGKQMLDEAKAKGTAQKVMGKEYEVRHILLKLNPLLNDAQAKAELERIRSEIISGKMTFADAALKYSKDYLSGANGGSLGYAFPEAYVGPFAKMVETTPQGTISAPFKSEFGWHILEVTGSRDGDKTEDAYRQKAYEQIVNSQLQDATKDWVKALRKNADIQYFDK